MDPVHLRAQFDEIAQAEWRHLYHAAILAGVPAQDAEDVVQETLLRAYLALQRMTVDRLGHLKLHSWLTALAQNTARKKKFVGGKAS